jgi:enamine deaminase RidA (YjgF/YER057c/UK114 family)
MSAYERLRQLGLSLPDLAPTHEFRRLSVAGDLAFVSGHAPFADGEFQYRGKVGRELDLGAARRASEIALLGCLASVHHELGSLDAIRAVRKLNGYVNCAPDFEALPDVTDAASRLLIQLLGETGRHARTTVGVASLPAGVAVEIDLILTISSTIAL